MGTAPMDGDVCHISLSMTATSYFILTELKVQCTAFTHFSQLIGLEKFSSPCEVSEWSFHKPERISQQATSALV